MEIGESHAHNILPVQTNPNKDDNADGKEGEAEAEAKSNSAGSWSSLSIPIPVSVCSHMSPPDSRQTWVSSLTTDSATRPESPAVQESKFFHLLGLSTDIIGFDRNGALLLNFGE